MPEATDRVVVDSLFIPAPVVCGALVFDPVLGVHYGFIIASLGKRETCLLCFDCLLGLCGLLVFCVSSSRCRGLVCSTYILKASYNT